MNQKLAWLLTSIALAVCLPIQQTIAASDQPFPKDYVIHASYDDVWSALIERATDKSWPIKTIDKASGVIATDFVILAQGPSSIGLRSVAYEPKTFLGTWNAARQTLNIFVSKLEGELTRVKIKSHYEGFENNASHQWIPWESNGAQEHQIVEETASKLNAAYDVYESTASTLKK